MAHGADWHLYLAWLGQTVPVFLVILARTAGMLVQMPILGNRQAVPTSVRTALAVALTLVYWASLTTLPSVPETLFPFIVLLLSEFLVGLAFGFAANVTFLAIQGAGELVGTAIQLNIASTLRIPGQPQSTVLGPVFMNIAQVVMLVMGAHIWLLRAFYQSFDLVPVGQFYFTPALMGALTQVTAGFFLIAIQLAMPAIMVMFLVNFGLGMLNRAIPSISNILELVMGVQPTVGFLLLILMLPNLVTAIHGYADHMIRDMGAIMSMSHR